MLAFVRVALPCACSRRGVSLTPSCQLPRPRPVLRTQSRTIVLVLVLVLVRILVLVRLPGERPQLTQTTLRPLTVAPALLWLILKKMTFNGTNCHLPLPSRSPTIPTDRLHPTLARQSEPP